MEFDRETYPKGSTWFDTEARRFVEMYYVHQIVSLKPIDGKTTLPYCISYEELERGRLKRYNIRMKQ